MTSKKSNKNSSRSRSKKRRMLDPETTKDLSGRHEMDTSTSSTDMGDEEQDNQNCCINCATSLGSLPNDRMTEVRRKRVDYSGRRSQGRKVSVSVFQALETVFKLNNRLSEAEGILSDSGSRNESSYYACPKCGQLLEIAYNAMEDFKRLTKAGGIFGQLAGISNTGGTRRKVLVRSSVKKEDTASCDVSVTLRKTSLKRHKCLQCSKLFSSNVLLSKHYKLLHGRYQQDRKKSKSLSAYLMEPDADSVELDIDNDTLVDLPTKELPGSKNKEIGFLCKGDEKEATEKLKVGKQCFECDVCGKQFNRLDHCQMHLRTHTGEKPYSCETCGKAFSDPRGLSFHGITHSNERPYCCTICGQTFKRRHHLNDHEKTHRDTPRPFECSLCGKSFKYKKHLNSHAVTHRNTKEHQCHICLKSFNRKDNLGQHIRKVHNRKNSEGHKSKVKKQRLKKEILNDSHDHEQKTAKVTSVDPITSKTALVTTSNSDTLIFNYSKPMTLAPYNKFRKQRKEILSSNESLPNIGYSAPVVSRLIETEASRNNVDNSESSPLPVAIAIANQSLEQIVYMHL